MNVHVWNGAVTKAEMIAFLENKIEIRSLTSEFLAKTHHLNMCQIIM